jgi:flavin-dependent thymidylate synthase
MAGLGVGTKVEPKYYQTVSPIGRPIIELLGVEIVSTCIETIRRLEASDRQMDSFNFISAIKYLWRLGLKTPEVRNDLDKAIKYLKWELDNCKFPLLRGNIKRAITECERLRDLAPSLIAKPRSPQLIKDPYFRVEIDLNASSPKPAHGIWTAQHVCVSENFAPSDPIPENPAAAIIDKQLKVKHWSVLDFSFVVLHFCGFPHDTVMQLCRHQGKNSPLVQSMRYTGERIRQIDSYNHDTDIEQLFYVQPVGSYPCRSGFYDFTESDRHEYLAEYQLGAQAYARAISKGQPEETARRLLPSGYRQNFTMAGTVRSVFHMLDQRTLADSQIEAQTLAWMALEKLEAWEPGLFGWYRKHRAGRNLLAP